jgi:hypothetical protein
MNLHGIGTDGPGLAEVATLNEYGKEPMKI